MEISRENKYTKGAKKRWENVSREERSEIMRELAKKKNAKMTPEQRKELSNKMNKIKYNKLDY